MINLQAFKRKAATRPVSKLLCAERQRWNNRRMPRSPPVSTNPAAPAASANEVTLAALAHCSSSKSDPLHYMPAGD